MITLTRFKIHITYYKGYINISMTVHNKNAHNTAVLNLN